MRHEIDIVVPEREPQVVNVSTQRQLGAEALDVERFKIPVNSRPGAKGEVVFTDQATGEIVYRGNPEETTSKELVSEAKDFELAA